MYKTTHINWWDNSYEMPSSSKDKSDNGKKNPALFLEDHLHVEENQSTGCKVEVKIIYLQNSNIQSKLRNKRCNSHSTHYHKTSNTCISNFKLFYFYELCWDIFHSLQYVTITKCALICSSFFWSLIHLSASRYIIQVHKVFKNLSGGSSIWLCCINFFFLLIFSYKSFPLVSNNF